MKLKDYIITREKEALDNGLEKEGIRYLLTEYFYHDSYTLLNKLNYEIDEKELDKIINQYIYKKNSCQYILGYQYFYGRKFVVNNNVLIPRPETELLCEKAIEIIKTNNIKSVLDIGTGSGIIPITIYKELEENNIKLNRIDALDISIEAINVALTNSKAYNANINFFQSDLFDKCTKKYDLIISNPPYIPVNYAIDNYVKNNEPNIALFAGIEGLDIYKRIIEDLDKYLIQDGLKKYILFEIGFDQKGKLTKLIKEKYPEAIINVYKDYNNLDRILLIEMGGK